MAISHAASGQLIDVHRLADQFSETRTFALFKTDQLEVMRLVVPAHKTVPSHQVKGEMTLQCMDGEVDFTADGKTQRMKAGQLVWLAGGVAHSLTAVQDSSLLATLVLLK
jgi:quercetin dioxygenase-like cupin family protein